MTMKNKKSKVNADIDEQEEGVSYEKGREFENHFAEFLKDGLGWEKIRVGAHMPGRNNAKGTSIDVLGERLDELGIKYKKIANNWMIASGCLLIGALTWYVQDWGNDGFWFLILSLMSLLGGLIFRLLSDANNKQNCWVECKNLKGKANINHISKMLREYNDFKLSKNGDHRFTHLYFASANGYVENTLKMAMDNNVSCYEWNGKSFVEVNYWDKKNDSKKA